MSIRHHPNDALLLDYATGALGEAWALAVGTHLALCPVCRGAVSENEAVGGALLEDMADAAPAPGSFESLMARLDHMAEGASVAMAAVARNSSPVLPDPLRGYVGGDVDSIAWRQLGRGAYQKVILVDGDGITARLLSIPAGQPVPWHSHRGLELTLVLSGAFTDATGRYRRGDLQEADQGLLHQPHATPEEDCVCLAVTDAPLRFSSLAARLVQPFLGI